MTTHPPETDSPGVQQAVKHENTVGRWTAMAGYDGYNGGEVGQLNVDPGNQEDGIEQKRGPTRDSHFAKALYGGGGGIRRINLGLS
jgi:hypothetical protein